MWKDVNGKTGTRRLKGASGKVYGNMKLYSPAEMADILADGIVEIPYTPKPEPTPEQLERRRKRQIRMMASERIDYHLTGTQEEGDNTLLNTLLDMIEVQVDLFRDLKTKGLMTNADFNQRVIDMKDRLVLYRDVKQAMRNSIQNSEDVATFKVALDALIPDPNPEELV